jgi:outer membrane protein assembly factor BamB
MVRGGNEEASMQGISCVKMTRGGMMSSRTLMHWILRIAIVVLPASVLNAAEALPDAPARVVMNKAGIRVGVCEIPRIGDGTLAAALAKQGVGMVHALAADANAAEAARKPAAGCGLLGSQVIVEMGKPDALPLGDWVADLYVVADATDANLKELSATEAGRVLSPYRGVAVVGNPARGAVTRAALEQWAKGTGGTATISDDPDGLWAIVKMPPLKGGDDWSHYYHGPDGNPVSRDTVFAGTSYQLQSFDYPIRGARNYTIVASAGRFFVANSTLYSGEMMAWAQIPSELVARSLYNARVLWRRPLSVRFGDMGSLLVAMPDKLYVKDGTGVLILDPETGKQISRIEATQEPRNVMWLAISDGVLLTLAGGKAFAPLVDIPGGFFSAKTKEIYATWQNASEGQELTARDAQSGKELWRFTGERIAMRKLAVSGGRIFLHVNASDAMALDLRTGKQIWKTPAPLPEFKPGLWSDVMSIANANRGEPHALATPTAYVIFDPLHLQNWAFDAADGHQLWSRPGDPKNSWNNLRNLLVMGDILMGAGGGLPLTLPTGEYLAGGKNPGGFPSASCGHSTAVDCGLWVGYGVIDMKTGRQMAPNMAKAPCGTGFFVADAVEVLYPNTCACRGWHGLMLIRPTVTGKDPAGSRLEKGDAPPVLDVKVDASDWTSYRSDESRKGSSSAVVPANAAIRWTYVPPRQADGTGIADLPAYLERDKYATQAIAVGDRVCFGSADGAVVCLDRQTGGRQWEHWTAGKILSAPVWSEGRVYAGSADGWMYCLDGATGQLCWRYRVAPEDRRISVMGRLSSAWPVQAILVHDGVAYASAGVLGQLDGSAMCAVDARTGEERWSKVLRNSGETYPNGKLKNQTPTAYGGQMACYGGKIWWQGVEFGPAVIDPASGAMKRAMDESHLGADDSMYYDLSGTWNLLRGKDIGILPGGWVAIGNELMHGSCGQTDHILLRSGPDGIPAGGEYAPQLLSVNLKGEGGAWFSINREIPVWDAGEVLTRGNPVTSGGRPTLYRGFTEALSKEGDAHPIKTGARKKLVPGTDDLVRAVALSLPADQQHSVLPDALWNEIDKRRTVVYGTMLLAGNAVVLAVHGTDSQVTDLGNGRMPNYGDWRVIAINRNDRTTFRFLDLVVSDAAILSGTGFT